MKLFLTGNVVTEEIPTLSLVDFMWSQPLVEGEFICPKQNAPLVATLQNLQIVLQVLLSNDFCDRHYPGGLQGLGKVKVSEVADDASYLVRRAKGDKGVIA